MSFQTSTLPPHRALFTAFALIGLCTWSACQHQQAENAAAAAPLEKTEVYGTGQVSRRYQEINGKKEGKMTDYYPDGKLKAERWFKDDKQIGRTLLYYPNGSVKEVQYYQDGRKEGGDTLFYENGRVEFTVQYHQEKKNGYLRKWTPTGDLVVEVKYEMDSLIEVKGQPIHPGSAAK